MSISRSASQVNRFNQDYFNPYGNYHRPCLFPKTALDAKGKQHLKPGVTFQSLDAQAFAISDNEAANGLQNARRQLFETIFERRQAS